MGSHLPLIRRLVKVCSEIISNDGTESETGANCISVCSTETSSLKSVIVANDDDGFETDCRFVPELVPNVWRVTIMELEVSQPLCWLIFPNGTQSQQQWQARQFIVFYSLTMPI